MPEVFRNNRPIVHINFFHDHTDLSIPLLRFYAEEYIEFDLLIYDKEKQTEYSLVDAQIIFKIKQKKCDDEYMYTYDSNVDTTRLPIVNAAKGYMSVVMPKAEAQALDVGDHPFHVILIKDGKERIIVQDYISLLEV